MNPTITTNVITTRNGSHQAVTCRDNFFCLYRCEFCNQITLAKGAFSFTFSCQYNQTEKAIKEEAVKRAGLVFQKLKSPYDEDILDLLNVSFSFRKGCGYCRKVPVWAAQMAQVDQKMRAWTKKIVIFGFILSCISIIDVIKGGGLRWIILFLSIFVGASLTLKLIRRYLYGKAMTQIIESVHATVPLFFDTWEELESLAQKTSQYRKMPLDSIRALAEKEYGGFGVKEKE